ncbi:hypothetical protein [Mucilaginibacter paludis]|uniref:Uncharacterized protein n=1 Tax=Mucilaginibacter paludis DSM 18603 TaxID=714943 RepID=H1YI09_9SPHI|nr:hypothetical protein [Mucilaginibacter paludis]EHQ25557.1 hypothetical protein Mucpa_1397 [Mucilaginibacter paludis DSM 18603]
MKNFKQVAYGLLVGAMAIGFSAFTNAKESNEAVKIHKALKAGMITDNFIVQPTLNNFVQESSVNTSNCGDPATRQCVYDVTTSGKSNIPDQASYTAAEIDNYISHSWLTPASGSSAALYQP